MSAGCDKSRICIRPVMEPECGVHCISEARAEAKQDDVYCKLQAACLALVTACYSPWNVDFPCQGVSGA